MKAITPIPAQLLNTALEAFRSHLVHYGFPEVEAQSEQLPDGVIGGQPTFVLNLITLQDPPITAVITMDQAASLRIGPAIFVRAGRRAAYDIKKLVTL